MNVQQVDSSHPRLLAHALRRRWKVVLVIALLTSAVGGTLFSLRPASYTSASSVLVRPILGNALSPTAVASTQQVSVSMETEANLVTSAQVTQLASDQLGEPIEPASPAISVTIPPNSQILEISYRAADPEAAQSRTRAMATSYLQYRSDQATEDKAQQLTSLKKQQRTVQARLEFLGLKGGTGAVAAAQIQLLTNRLSDIEATIGEVSGLDTRPGTIVKPASVPAKPGLTIELLAYLLALFVGMGLGIAAALWRTRFDDRIWVSSDMRNLGAPVLSVVRPGTPFALGADSAVHDRLAVSYRRARIGVLSRTTTPCTLAVAPASPELDAYAIAGNLAQSLTKAQFRVALVDASLLDPGRQPAASALDTPGLSDHLVGGADVPPLRTDTGGLYVVLAGSFSEAARDAFASVGMHEYLNRLRGDFDFVIVVTPPLVSPDGATVAIRCDATIVVGQDRVTTIKQAQAALQLAQQLRFELIGFIFVERSARRERGPRGREQLAGLQPTGSGDREPTMPATEHSNATEPVKDARDAGRGLSVDEKTQ